MGSISPEELVRFRLLSRGEFYGDFVSSGESESAGWKTTHLRAILPSAAYKRAVWCQLVDPSFRLTLANFRILEILKLS